MNYLTDIIVQPVISTFVELTLWTAVFASLGSATLNGFAKEYYLAYVIWAAFVARITSNWMYEYKMIEEVEVGTVNTVLVRPISFYEYYLSQFLGYKASTMAFSLLVPLAVVMYLKLPTEFSRIPLVILLILFYLIMLHTLSFCVACLAFRLNRVSSLTVAKNLTLWVLSGELFPLDLLPDPIKSWVIALPFSAAVYLPVGYLTGRLQLPMIINGFISLAMGTLVIGAIARLLWQSGVESYTGTGA